MFPINRMRRLRSTPYLRDLFAETNLTMNDIIYPVFVEENINEPAEITSLPDIFRIPEKQLAAHVKLLWQEGIRAIILFGIPHHKDSCGTESLTEKGLLYRMIEIAKNAVPELVVISDNCFCEYTDHGHCGIIKNNTVDNDLTIKALGEQAVICAKAGADVIAPSSMMDGQVYSIRQSLDAAGFSNKPIMSYSTKLASVYYEPFRDAVETHLMGDRKTYQMDYRNGKEAIRESLLDIDEGADILTVKPAGTALDIISQLKQTTHMPLAAYHTSGEYAAIEFAVKAGALNEEKAIRESLYGIKRAGADVIITYFARKLAKIL